MISYCNFNRVILWHKLYNNYPLKNFYIAKTILDLIIFN